MKNRNVNCHILLYVCDNVFCMGAFAHGAEKVKIALAGDSTVANYKPGDNIAGWRQMIRDIFIIRSCKEINFTSLAKYPDEIL